MTTTPARFLKKPVEVDAIQLAAEPIVCGGDTVDGNRIAIAAASGWMLGHGFAGFCVVDVDEGLGIAIETLEGTMLANPGDWIIRGTQGEFYPCKPAAFADTFERVDAVVPEVPAVDDHDARHTGSSAADADTQSPRNYSPDWRTDEHR